ncbi:MAG: hypothetical protein DHS20C09_10470 [marine bacterium B5-7]|nr:MAG: hypothetical protein DHS20C09_10470 [marine bacterium B5-7]
MPRSVDDVNLITSLNVNEYFNDAIHDAISHQGIYPKDETVVYIVNLLTYFTLSENMYEDSLEGRSSKPLALMFKDATEAKSTEEKNAHLRKLGDTALVTSGFFAGSFEGGVVGIDYFISMGGGAYSSLAENNSRTNRDKTLAEVFSDLAGHFLDYVDVLTEVRESNELTNDRDVLCLYESWSRTGSEYAKKRLQENGVLTFPSSKNKH